MLSLSRRAACLSLALVLALSPLARASDIVHLNTGGVVKGDIISETPEEVKIKTAGGVTTIFREDIERIERNRSAGDVYKDALAKLDAKDADGHYRLGREMQKLRLEKEAKECFEKALKIDPNHLPAKIALEEGKARGNDLAALAGDVAASSAKETRDAKDAREAPEPASVAGPIAVKGKVSVELTRSIVSAKKLMRELDPAKRAQGIAAMEALFQDALGQDSRYAILNALFSFEAEARKSYEKNVRRISAAISDYDKAEQKKIRNGYLAAWEKARKEALDVIFDLKIYPDENHGKVGQPKVDEKVDVVKKVYPTYEQLVLADISKFQALTEEQAGKIVDAVRGDKARLEAALVTLDKLLAMDDLGTDEAAPRPAVALADMPAGVPVAHETLLLYRAGRIEDAYANQDQLTPWEVRLLERMRDIRVETYNDKVWKDTAPLDKGKRPTVEERQQVKITNNYRIMMGRPALEIHPCLVESARGHSNEMTVLGYFAHESPVEKNRTPSDRAHNAGYDGGAAENISLGSNTPQATHDAWYNSSGHHRNILGADHVAMGSGLDGQHWTQNFGGHGLLVR